MTPTPEASAFDRQIRERIENGHIPDLRRAASCHYFYSNAWREPEYVKLDFGEKFEHINRTVVEHIDKIQRDVKILEVGCGPGYLSLELARQGYQVTGIDISEECIKTASRFADEDPWKAERGSLDYRVCDFSTSGDQLPVDFDAVTFLGSLHHFRAQDDVVAIASRRLRRDGIVIAQEPTRDRLEPGNAAVKLLVEVLLAAGGGFYRDVQVPSSTEDVERLLGETCAAMSYTSLNGCKTQSPNDNDAGYHQMVPALNRVFNQLHLEGQYSFFREVIGGLRFDHPKNVALAKFLREMDRYLCENGVVTAMEFFYAGRKRD